MGKEFKVTVAGTKVTVGTPKEAQALLLEAGIKATLKDIMGGKTSQVELVDIKPEPKEDTNDAKAETAQGEAASQEVSEDASKDEEKQSAEQPQEEVEAPTESPSDKGGESEDGDIEFPEVGYFADVKAMKRYTKKLTDDQLKEWCELEGATWKPNDHESINRMRMAMAIKAVHFPDTAPKGGSKTKSKYADYTTEQLVEMAMENDVEVTGDNGDMKILRMRAIMALRSHGIIE